MAAQATIERKDLHGGAIRWLDKKLEGKTFSQRHDDARALIGAAYAARGALERSLSFISPERADVRRTYSQYRSAVSQLISDLEGAISQMERLRGQFSKSEHNSQLPAYDRQLRTMKERLAGLREDEKWCPRELRGYKPTKENLVDAEGKISVKIAALERRGKETPKRTESPIAIAKAKKSREETQPETVLVKNDDKGMVFAFKEDLEKAPRIELPLPKEEDLRKKIKELNSEIAKAKEEGKRMKVRALRMERKNTWLALSSLTGEKPPKHVLGV